TSRRTGPSAARPPAATSDPTVLAHRIACLTAAATLALILAGGLVTDTGSALAVPDWPTTFGYNLFLYPWSKMVGGVLYEHSHRLLGAVVGALTVGLALVLWRGERRWWVRALGLAAVLRLAGAAAVFVFVPIVTARARATGQPAFAGPARALLGLLLVQLPLGAGAFLARFSALALPGGRATGLALPVVHRLVAALILGQVAALLAVLVRAGGAAADPARRATRLETVTLPSGP